MQSNEKVQYCKRNQNKMEYNISSVFPFNFSSYHIVPINDQLMRCKNNSRTTIGSALFNTCTQDLGDLGQNGDNYLKI